MSSKQPRRKARVYRLLAAIFILAPLIVVGYSSPGAAVTAQATGDEADIFAQCGLRGDLFSYSLFEPDYDENWLGINSDILGQLDYGTAFILFEISKLTISQSSVMVCALFSFTWAGAFSDAMGSVGENFYVELSDVYNWAIMATIFYVAYMFMRGKVIHGLREFGLTYLVFGLYLAAGLVNADGFTGLTLDVIEFTSQSSGAIAEITLEGQLDDDTNCESDHEIQSGEHTIRSTYAVSCPFASLIQQIFIEQPYDQLNWGADLDAFAGGACAPVRDSILQDLGPSDGEEARNRMRDAGECGQLADYNERSDTRRAPFTMMLLGFVILPMSAIFFFLGFVGLAAQFLLVLTIIALPWALIFGLTPGYSRTIWWRWFGLLFRVIAVFVTLSAFLSIYLVSVQAVIESTEGVNWFVRSLLLIFLALIMVVALAKMLRGARGASQLSAARVSQLALGDPEVWLPAVAGGDSTVISTRGSSNVYRGFRDYRSRRIANRSGKIAIRSARRR